LREVDRGREAPVESEPAEAGGEVAPRGDGARDGDGARAEAVDPAAVEPRRRAARAVQPDEVVVPPELRERVAADPRHLRLGDGEDRCGGECRVDGVPTLLE